MVDQQARPAFAVCIANDGCDDLTTGMIYRVLPDESAARDGYLRVHYERLGLRLQTWDEWVAAREGASAISASAQ